MRKYFLPEKGGAYKANLHCHSTISDGRFTVEELKKNYIAQGYSIIAYTDHDVLIDHRDLCDENFLALNGYELEVNESGQPWNRTRTAHMCFIAMTQDNLTQVCHHRDRYIWGNALAYKPQIKFEHDDYNRIYSHEGVSDMMKRGREAGFFVTYNHPAWSLEAYPEYSGYTGMNAFEIFNTGCERIGFNEYNSHVYDELLRQGKHIYCIAADDNHNAQLLDHPRSDSFGGWAVIRAEKLEYNTITKALVDGSFYASCGPEIKDFYMEDDTVHITTSPVHRINYITGTRHTEAVGAHYGESVTEASFKVNPNDVYFRLDVIDDRGNHANTNAVFVDTI